ncbi:MAG: DUF2273 domain-containing protein [Selenomonadaceae bacterium]|nr:DUF2273 domain-containing protein [Selenomonadaceae bacterium]
MKEDIELELKNLWNNHRKASFGLLLGILLGAFVLTFGFFNTLFVVLCAVLGLLIGKQLDRGEDVLGKIEYFLRTKFNLIKEDSRFHTRE